MFVTNDPSLVRDGYVDHGTLVEDYTLASQTGFEFGVDGAIYEIFFFIGDLLEVFSSSVNVNMTGRTGANTTAVAVEVNAAFFCNLQHGFSQGGVLY